MALATFEHDGFTLAFLDEVPDNHNGQTVLLIHGFASTHIVNWVGPGWVGTLTRAGYRVVALDNRGHGASQKSYDTADYTPAAMAGDAIALLDHLSIGRAHLFGYSMGARIAAVAALARPERAVSLILGGLGYGMVDGVGDWDPIAEALVAEDAASITHPRGRMFRAFADQTRSDRQALAACIETSRELIGEAELARLDLPVLVAVGTKDDIAGSAQQLARVMPHAVAFDISDRDHMLAVGDRAFKARVLEFLSEHAAP